LNSPENILLRRFRFIYKLFLAFLLTGIIPVVLLSTAFLFLSGDIMKGSYKQQSQIAVKRISDDLNELLDKYRHTIYQISQDEEIIGAILGDKAPPRSERLKLYRKMYTAISGHIDDVSLHIISLTGFPSISTQQVPKTYLSADSEAAGGVFSLARLQPEKPWTVFNHYINERGDYVMMSFCRTIRNSQADIIGFAVMDINKLHISSLSEKENNDFFSQLLIVDPKNNLASDLNHSENDGNFSRLPFLSLIPDGDPGLFTEGERMIIHHPLNLSPFLIVGTVPLDVILSNLDYLLRITIWQLLFCIILAILLSYLVSRSISNPVHQLALAMGRVEAGNLAVRISSDREDEIGLLFKRFNVMTEQIESLMAKTMEEQEELRTAERKALQAQINPHFLYNTLNTIKSIAKLEGIDQITTIVTQFGKLLRNTIESEKEMVSLRESLDLVESYLAIQKIRYGERLNYRINVPSEFMNYHIPKLILQPLVENAVIHGLEKKIEPGLISLNAQRQNGNLVIGVRDDGIGMSETLKPEKKNESTGVGMSNVHRRLELLYGEPFGLRINSSPGTGTEIQVVVPWNSEDQR